MTFVYNTGTPATSAYQNQIFNWYIIRYLKTPSSNGTTPPSLADFLNIDANSNVSPLSLRNNDLLEDFDVLAQGEVNLRLTNFTTVLSGETAVVNLEIPKSFHQTFNGTAAANIADNCCFIACVAINPSSSGGASQLLYSIRQWYIDN